MALIGPIVSNEWFFFVTIVALAALMILFEAGGAGSRRPYPKRPPKSAKLRGAHAASACG